MARVSEVQPTPVPTKPVPVACFTHTCTVNPRVLGNTAGIRKPVPVFCYFSILTWTFLFSYFLFLFLDVFSLLYYTLPIVTM